MLETALLTGFVRDSYDFGIRVDAARPKPDEDMGVYIRNMTALLRFVSIEGKNILLWALKKLSDGKSVVPIERGRRQFEDATNQILFSARDFETFLKGEGAWGCPPEELKEYQKAIVLAEETKALFDEYFPKLNPSRVRESHAAIERGESRPVEDFLDELQTATGEAG